MLGQREIRKLIKEKRYRHDTGLFWVDGVHFVQQALDAGWEMALGVSVPSKIDSDFKKQVVAQFDPAKSIELGENSYAALSARDDIQGVGAVFKMQPKLTGVQPGAGVVLENIANQGNLGTIARTCVAFGVKTLYVVNPAADPYGFEAVRASMGALFKLRIGIVGNVNSLKNSTHISIGTALQNSTALPNYSEKFKPTDNVLFWFGNEAKGLTTEARAMCRQLVKIPHLDMVDSLNISESAGIILYSLLKINNE